MIASLISLIIIQQKVIHKVSSYPRDPSANKNMLMYIKTGENILISDQFLKYFSFLTNHLVLHEFLLYLKE